MMYHNFYLKTITENNCNFSVAKCFVIYHILTKSLPWKNFQVTSLTDIITKLPESRVLCDNITEFGVVVLRHPKQSDIAT